MENAYETSAFVFVGGSTDLTEDDITKQLEILPTRTSKTPRPRGGNRPDGWKTWFFSTKSTDELKERNVEQVISELISAIHDKQDKFAALPDDCEREIVVTVFTDYYNVTTDISYSLLKTLSAFTFALKISSHAGPD